MNRGKKLVRNFVMIALILLGICFFDGYYLSRKKCVEDILRANEQAEMQEVLHVSEQTNSYTLIAAKNGEEAFVIETKKIGFLHHMVDIYSSYTVAYEPVTLPVAWIYTKEGTILNFVKRCDPSVERVGVQIGDGDIILYDVEWADDYAVVTVKADEGQAISYTYYNAFGEALESMAFPWY